MLYSFMEIAITKDHIWNTCIIKTGDYISRQGRHSCLQANTDILVAVLFFQGV